LTVGGDSELQKTGARSSHATAAGLNERNILTALGGDRVIE